MRIFLMISILLITTLSCDKEKKHKEKRHLKFRTYYDDEHVGGDKEYYKLQVLGKEVRCTSLDNEYFETKIKHETKRQRFHKNVLRPIIRNIISRNFSYFVKRITVNKFMYPALDPQYPLKGRRIKNAISHFTSNFGAHLLSGNFKEKLSNLRYFEVCISKSASHLYKIKYGIDIKIDDTIYVFSITDNSSTYRISGFVTTSPATE